MQSCSRLHALVVTSAEDTYGARFQFSILQLVWSDSRDVAVPLHETYALSNTHEALVWPPSIVMYILEVGDQ